MNKPIIRNWTRYWTSTFAIAGMLAMGACAGSNTAANDTGDYQDTTYGTETTTADTEEMNTDTEVVTNTETAEYDTETSTTEPTETTIDADDEYATTTQENTATGVTEEEYEEQEYTSTESTELSETQSATTPTTDTAEGTGVMQTQTEDSGMAGFSSTPGTETKGVTGSTDIIDPNKRATGFDAHVQQFAEVNDAIEDVLAKLALAEREAYAAQQGSSMQTTQMASENSGTTTQEGLAYDNMNTTEEPVTTSEPTTDQALTDTQTTGTELASEYAVNDTTSDTEMATNQPQDVTYDRMSNSDMEATAGEDAGYMGVYDIYMDPSQQLTEQERMMLEEARANMEQRRGQMDEQLTAYYLPAMEARPDVNYSELIEEIKEETVLPQELKDANMEGTVLVQFVVDEQGQISQAEVIDGIISQVKEDGTLMSFIRLTDRTQSEIAEEINKEDLLEYKGEGKDMIIDAVKKESMRLVESTSGKWQPAQQDDQPVKMVMVLPIRFDIED